VDRCAEPLEPHDPVAFTTRQDWQPSPYRPTGRNGGINHRFHDTGTDSENDACQAARSSWYYLVVSGL